MPALTRHRGVILPELLVALVLLGILSAIATTLFRHTQNVYQAESQGIDVQQNLRIAAAFLPAELRELDATGGDLISMGTTAITIRAPRQLAVVCRRPQLGDPSALVTLTLRDSPSYGYRDFNPATDSLWAYYEGDPGTRQDDGWVLGSIASLEPDTCPDGRSGRRVTTMLRPVPDQTMVTGMIPLGAPVLGFETLTYRLYRSGEDGRWYVGMKTAVDLQPVLGPVTSNGLALAYYDSSGAVTAEPSQVSMIEVRVRAETPRPIRRPGGRLERSVDSLVTVVSLRNNRRY